MQLIRSNSKLLRLAVILITGVMAISTLLMASSPVSAQAVGPRVPTRVATAAALVNNSLERAFSREKDWLTVQTNNLQRLDSLSGQVENMIAKAQARGVDTAALQTALNTFNSQTATAKANSATASAILASHVGFAADGTVTDSAAAHQTLVSGRQSLLDAHVLILQAATDLRSAIRSFRAAHKGGQAAYPVPTK
jgi:hypothetical protein